VSLYPLGFGDWKAVNWISMRGVNAHALFALLVSLFVRFFDKIGA
jgi:hypothetical protein